MHGLLLHVHKHCEEGVPSYLCSEPVQVIGKLLLYSVAVCFDSSRCHAPAQVHPECAVLVNMHVDVYRNSLYWVSPELKTACSGRSAYVTTYVHTCTCKHFAVQKSVVGQACTFSPGPSTSRLALYSTSTCTHIVFVHGCTTVTCTCMYMDNVHTNESEDT